MQYSIEESALIGGLIAEYFSRTSVSETLRMAYRRAHQHLLDGRCSLSFPPNAKHRKPSAQRF